MKNRENIKIKKKEKFRNNKSKIKLTAFYASMLDRFMLFLKKNYYKDINNVKLYRKNSHF